MKWKKPKHGEERIVTRFALLPKKLTDGTKVWFEKYTTEERYTVNGPNVGLSFPDFWLMERKPAWIEEKSYQ